MALHIVRTLGQAFDVCHKLNPRPKKKRSQDDAKKEEKTETELTEAEKRKEEEAKEANEVDDLEKEFQELALKSTANNINQSTVDPFSPGGAKLANGTVGFDPLDLPLPPPDLESTDSAGGAPVPSSHLAYIGRPRPRPSQVWVSVLLMICWFLCHTHTHTHTHTPTSDDN